MIFTAVNFLMTIVGVMLVDRKGRKFLLLLGTSGIIISMIATGTLFLKTEGANADVREQIQAMVGGDQQLSLHFDRALAEKLLSGSGEAGNAIASDHASLAIIYSYGAFTASTSYVRSDDLSAGALDVTGQAVCPQIRWSHSSRTRLPIWMLRARLRSHCEGADCADSRRYAWMVGGHLPVCLWRFMRWGRECAVGWPSQS